ncbi:hypothetical protein [Flagellimonas nanhaiensis]|uniref:Uncharacterized protein n=1 Tax=Flagellimonas nanhaiensis TaxID=2292706 RepID=A0A371JLB4_9FLAO|nr:hypothetical protein [Allomuricauda nanhaiensis]RDY57733.1 hypothetical protein DX873_17700 [Allomuricauda nanhaiensis]
MGSEIKKVDLIELERVCQEVLRLEYRLFRKNMRDPHFVDSNYKAHKELQNMMFNVRQKIEDRVYISSHAENYLQAQIMLTDYVKMGREYGLKYGKKLGVMRD